MQPGARWISFLASMTFAFLLASSCGDDKTPKTGAELFLTQGCSNCHGPDGAGMPGFAPTLHGKKSFWTREKLVAYLKDPKTYREKEPRLKEQGRPYSLAMPPSIALTPDELGRLADHVLAMP
jgi:mono/diheme cytochrome c family protein